ncbi:MAG: DUF3016 domain-containing protein [Gemmatimonadota bacterium]
MRVIRHSIAVILGAGLIASSALAEVNVTFVKPELYSDVSDRVVERDEILKQLEQHFQTLGRKYLRKDEKLTIEVLDIDRAGHMRGLMRLFKDPDMRVVSDRGGDAPRIRFRYRIEAPGQPPKTGEETLLDGAFLSRFNPYAESDPLRYEKLMIDDWFKQHFAGAGTGAR